MGRNLLCRPLPAALLLLLCVSANAQEHFGKDTLIGVTVKARKPLVTRKIDRFIINVAESFLADGRSALEVLQQAPGIWVDPKGSIRVRGNKPVTVMINQQVLRMSGDELAEYLRSLRSEDIARIEVVTNPPADYEASDGAVIQIILKKPVTNGMKGSANAQYRRQGSKSYSTTGSSVDYKASNWYIQGSYAYSKDNRQLVEDALIKYKGKGDYTNHTDREENTDRRTYRLGVAYDADKNHSVGIETSGTRTGVEQLFYTTSNDFSKNIAISGTVDANRQRRVSFNSTTVNYTWKIDTLGSVFTCIADYTNNNRKEHADFNEQYSEPAQNRIYHNDVRALTDIYTAQANYNRKLPGKLEFKTGLKFASLKRDNKLLQEAAQQRFMYHETLAMAYGAVDKTIGQLGMKAGLRLERTASDGEVMNAAGQLSRTYTSLFPSLFLMYTFKEEKGNSLFLSYAKKIMRPSLSDLNPNRLQFNNYTAVTGNPRINPQYAHNFELGYNFLHNYAISAYASITNDAISLLADTGSNNFIEYYTVNFRKSNEYGISINAPLKITGWWNCNNSLSLYNVSFSNEYLVSQQSSFACKSVHTATIKKWFDADLVIDYRSATATSNLKMPYQFYIDLGFAKKLKNDQWRCRLSATDLFNTIREKEITDDKGIYIDFYRKRPSRTIALTIT